MCDFISILSVISSISFLISIYVCAAITLGIVFVHGNDSASAFAAVALGFTVYVHVGVPVCVLVVVLVGFPFCVPVVSPVL